MQFTQDGTLNDCINWNRRCDQASESRGEIRINRARLTTQRCARTPPEWIQKKDELANGSEHVVRIELLGGNASKVRYALILLPYVVFQTLFTKASATINVTHARCWYNSTTYCFADRSLAWLCAFDQIYPIPTLIRCKTTQMRVASQVASAPLHTHLCERCNGIMQRHLSSARSLGGKEETPWW